MAGLRQRRRDTIVLGIVTVIREDWRNGETPTLLNHEGALRALLRSGFCLGGMGWALANETAIEIVTEAFRKAGAKRPAWKESQPEWTDGGVIRDTRLRCANCERPLEPGQKTFCGKLCFDALRGRQAYHQRMDEARMIERLNQPRLSNAA